MGGNGFDVFRVLAGVFTWGLPAVLILALVVFIVALPVLAIAGGALRLKDCLGNRFHRANWKDPEIAALERLWR
ncbi:MAG: hypothetical protein A2147_05445 [Chloroflexi bacterium RBG_16_57_8]|nr:MAG: hypothetical protein A2147_05445 [Chloroflexi bacterium RBG_16_57_8]